MLNLEHHIRVKIATGIAILFHVIGIAGILFAEDKTFFISATPFHLVLMGVLLVYTQKNPNQPFYIALFLSLLIGFLVESIGVHTGLLFGQYSYGEILGIKIWEVPLLIGINWWMVMSGSANMMEKLWQVLGKKELDTAFQHSIWKTISFIIDGAVIATFFDWVMEPVAIKLGYWHWIGLDIPPGYNYLCWFLISSLILWIIQLCKYEKDNAFGMHLLMIQFTYFAILRLYL